jgi:hypothetical protein
MTQNHMDLPGPVGVPCSTAELLLGLAHPNSKARAKAVFLLGQAGV